MSVRPVPGAPHHAGHAKVGEFGRAGGPNSPTFGRTTSESTISRPQPAKHTTLATPSPLSPSLPRRSWTRAAAYKPQILRKGNSRPRSTDRQPQRATGPQAGADRHVRKLCVSARKAGSRGSGLTDVRQVSTGSGVGVQRPGAPLRHQRPHTRNPSRCSTGAATEPHPGGVPRRNRVRPILVLARPPDHPAGNGARTTRQPKGAPPMRVRIGSTIAVVAAAIAISGGIAGPIYSAFGGNSATSATTAGAASTNGRIMR
jgi:hypothetical protein